MVKNSELSNKFWITHEWSRSCLHNYKKQIPSQPKTQKKFFAMLTNYQFLFIRVMKEKSNEYMCHDIFRKKNILCILSDVYRIVIGQIVQNFNRNITVTNLFNSR